MEYLKKKKLKKDIEQIVQANNSFIEFSKYLQEKYVLLEDDKTNLQTLSIHLQNMNALFITMSDQVTNNKNKAVK